MTVAILLLKISLLKSTATGLLMTLKSAVQRLETVSAANLSFPIVLNDMKEISNSLKAIRKRQWRRYKDRPSSLAANVPGEQWLRLKTALAARLFPLIRLSMKDSDSYADNLLLSTIRLHLTAHQIFQMNRFLRPIISWSKLNSASESSRTISV